MRSHAVARASRRSRRRLHDGAGLRAAEGRCAGRVPLRAQGRRGNGEHRVVEAVRRPGARSADRHGARQQPERQGRRRERRAGAGADHADALGALSAGRLRRRPASATRTPESGIVAAIPNYPNPQTAYQALLTASWEIDLWGRIRRLSESAQANMLATDEARRGVILTLVSSVATNYLTLRGLDEQLVIANRTLGTYARIGAPLPAAVQVRADLADDRLAGAVAVRDRGRADSADRVADRADRERAVGPARAATPDRSRAASRSTISRCRPCPPACRRRCSSGGPTSCRPSRR